MNNFFDTITSRFNLIETYIDLGLVVICFIFSLICLIKFRASKFTILGYVVDIVFVIASFLFNLKITFYLSIAFLICFTSGFIFSNLASFRRFFAKTKKNEVIHSSNPGETIYDSKSLSKIIYDTVAYCSKVKMGAIMTFEKEDDLSNVTKNGTVIHAPVSQEILITIFYPGTRLHDGAVIIKGNQIIAASVYYTPTTKALTGKYGSRHRAAIGISEITDSVTVVVSEETGRISLAYEGELQSVSLDRFITKFNELMNERKED